MLLISIIIILIAIDIIDSMTMIIPNSLLCILVLLVICYTLQYSSITLIESVVGMLVVSMPMLLINRYVLEAFGGGDIKLMVVMGFFLGWKKVILTIILATLLGGVYASWLLVIKKTSSKYIPFAPYLCKSVLITMFFSERIISWYFGNF
jgi:prepilin signal peptidase PulO-like enzyme (type II secretory pathway)